MTFRTFKTSYLQRPFTASAELADLSESYLEGKMQTVYADFAGRRAR